MLAVAEIIQQAFEYGVLGALCLGLAVALRVMYGHARQDRKTHTAELVEVQRLLSEEQRLRVADANRYTGVALGMQAEVISSIAAIDKATGENSKLCDLVEKLVDSVDDTLEELKADRRRREN